MEKVTPSPSKQVVAVVGVSNDPSKYGHKIFADLLESGYEVYGINPKGGEVAGQSLFPSLKALPITPTMALTVVPPAVTLQVVQECAALKIPTIWMQPGSESDEAIQAAQQAGLHTIAHACFMKQEKIW